jgi:ABC-type transporter Mla subunit MlaD
MQGEKIMQLLMVIVLLSLCAKGENLSDIKPLIAELGDENINKAFREAESFTEILNCLKDILPQNNNSLNKEREGNANVSSFSGQTNCANQNSRAGGTNQATEPIQAESDFFPLSPISNIADKKITYSLSQYLTPQV